MRAVYATRAVAITGALVTWAFMVYAGKPEGWFWYVMALPFAAWAAVPFWAVSNAASRHRESTVATRLFLGAAILLTSGSLYFLYNAFVVSPDAQSGLVFLFLPAWQMIGCAPFIIIASVVAKREG